MTYKISHENYTIEVDEHGAELVSLMRYRKNYLWEKKDPYWQRRAPVLFPVVGKLKDNKYFLNGKEYSLPQHGFARDMPFQLHYQNASEIELTLNESFVPGYPFHFELAINYALDETGVLITYTVTNKGSDPMPFSIGAHPAFQCPVADTETLEDYEIVFPDDETLTRHTLKEGLRTGETETVSLHNHVLKLSEDLFADDALVLNAFTSKKVILRSKEVTIEVHSDDCTWLGLWKQPKAPFVCIEPWWGVADAMNSNGDMLQKEGIMLLPARETRQFRYRISISGAGDF